jgi:hypothetical protein
MSVDLTPVLLSIDFLNKENDVDDLGFHYIDVHKAWFHTPTSSLIFMHELFSRGDEEIALLVFNRTGENPSQWLIECLKNPLDDIVA